MKDAVETEAPAKLNLSLRVLGRREDGFHDIDSIMVRLPGLHDSLSFAQAGQDAFTCNASDVPTDESNLVVKAISVFRRESRIDVPLAVHLEKRVPHGAGLGGGSSDAASTLMALDEMFGTGIGRGRLRELSAELGSDIPYFLGPAVGRATGRGERLEQGPQLPPLPVLLLKPGFGVATPGAYQAWWGSRKLPSIHYDAQKFTWGELVNDLERPVFQKYPFLAEMKLWLMQRPEVAGALMSGSGSTMFAVLENLRDAGEVISAAHRELDPTLWSWSGEVQEGL